jgi:outer membrane protein assembly factor BamB
VSRRLDEARELIKRGEIDRSLYLLQSLLDEENSSFLKTADGRWECSRDMAESIILSADPRLLRRYRELHADQANRLLSNPSNVHAPSRWAEVARRFSLTPAGRDAADLLGSWHLDHGNPALASTWFRRVLESPAHVDSNLEMVRLKQAACQMVMGLPVDDALLPEQMVIAGQLTPTRSWISRMVAEWSPPQAGQGVGSAKIERGSLPLLDPVWTFPLTEDATLAGILSEAVDASASRKTPILFGYRTVRVGDAWGIRTLDGASIRSAADGTQRSEIVTRSSILSELKKPDFQAIHLSAAPGGIECAFFANQVYGRITEDGERMYLVDDLSLNPQYQQMPFVNRRGSDPSLDRSRNAIVAIDARSGKIAWRLDGGWKPADGNPPPVYFFGPPIRWNDYLYVIGESRGEMALFAIDPQTGKIAWREILAVAARGVDADLFRRSQTCELVIHQGILLCPTNLYRLVAIDPLSRRRLWDYSLASEGNVPIHYTMGMQAVIVPSSLAVDPPVVDGNVVMATEAVGQRIHGFDLLSGEPRWQVKRDGDAFLAGSRTGRLIAVGPGRVRAISTASGQEIWTRSIPQPSGRGTWIDEFYLLPTSDGRVVVIDTRQGEIVLQMPTRDRLPLGNLDRSGDRFWAVGGGGFQIFRTMTEVRREVDQLLSARSDDPVGLYQRAQLSVAQGETAAAIEDLRASMKSKGDRATTEAARDLLFDIARSQWNTLEKAGSSFVQELGTLAETTEEKGVYLRLLADDRGRSNDWQGMLAAIDEHSKLGPTEPIPADEPSVERSSTAWAHAFLSRWLKQTGPQKGDLLRVLENRLSQASATGENAPLATLAKTLPIDRLVVDARVRQARQLGAKKERALAELAWLDVLEHQQPRQQAEALIQLIELASATGRPADASYFLKRLESEHRETALPSGESSIAWIRRWKESHPAADDLLANPSWPIDAIRVETERAYRPDPNKRLAFPVEGSLPFFRDWSIYYDQQRWEVEFVRRSTGQLDWKLTQLPPSLAYQQPVTFHQVGSLLLFEQSDSVYAISGLERKLAWHRSFDDTSVELSRHVGTSGNTRILRASSPFGSGGQMTWPRIIATGPARVVVRAGRQLAVLDTANGELLWRRTDLRQDQLASADREYVVLISPTGDYSLHQASDGEKLDSSSIGNDIRSMRGTLGRKLLLFQTSREGNPSRLLYLYDPATKQNVWKITLPVGTEWKMADDQRIVLFGGKRLVIVDATTGKVILEDDIEPVPPENGSSLQLSTFADDDRLYLTALRAVPGQNSWPVSPSNNLRLAPVHGWVRAYDLASRKLLWTREMFNRSLITSPGRDLPVLVAVGSRMIDLGENRKRMATDVEIVDKRTGKLLATQQHDQYGTMLELLSSQTPPLVELRGYNLKVRFLFGTEKKEAAKDAEQTPNAGSPFMQRFLQRAREERLKIQGPESKAGGTSP